VNSQTKAERQQSREPSVQQRNQDIRFLAFVVIAVLVLGVAIYFLKSALFREAPASLAGGVTEVAADMSGFDPKEIMVKAGVSVTLRLTSMDNSAHTDGGGKHQWAIDELGINVIAEPLGSALVTFTPTKPGHYDYYCDICCGGRANPTMHGILIVEA
jgi:heme/copper-type cytochrome/quinol oxidase subunit 2